MSLWRSADAGTQRTSYRSSSVIPCSVNSWQACDPCHSSAGCPHCRQASVEWWLMLAWDVLPSALVCVSNHGCWFQLAQSHAPILTSLIQGLCLWLHFILSCHSVNRVKMFGVYVAPGNGGSLVMLAKTFQLWPAKHCWSLVRWGKGAGGWANDVRAALIISLNSGWSWWLVAAWCWVDWCWPALPYRALPCGPHCVNTVTVVNLLVP